MSELFDPTAIVTVPAGEFETKVPADFRGLYKQDGENYVIANDNPAVKSAVTLLSAHRNLLTTVRKEAKSLKDKQVDLTPFQEYGTTVPEIIENFKTKRENLEAQIRGVNPAKMKEDLAKEWQPKLDTATTRAKNLESQLYNVLVKGEAVSALAEAKGDAVLLLPFVERQVKVIEFEGMQHVRVVDGEGNVRTSSSTGQPMTVKELVAEMKGQDTFSKLFASEAPAGSGVRPGTTTNNRQQQQQQRQTKTDGMTPNEKIAAGLKAIR